MKTPRSEQPQGPTKNEQHQNQRLRTVSSKILPGVLSILLILTLQPRIKYDKRSARKYMDIRHYDYVVSEIAVRSMLGKRKLIYKTHIKTIFITLTLVYNMAAFFEVLKQNALADLISVCLLIDDRK